MACIPSGYGVMVREINILSPSQELTLDPLTGSQAFKLRLSVLGDAFLLAGSALSEVDACLLEHLVGPVVLSGSAPRSAGATGCCRSTGAGYFGYGQSSQSHG